MKGQYLAVESILTFGLGIAAAIGVIVTFENYSSGVYDAAEDVEAQIVKDRIMEEAYQIRNVQGESRVEIDLPDTIANRDYRVEASDNLKIIVRNREYVTETPFDHSFTGEASGEIELVKTSEGLEIGDR